jgi:hypothetical protein
MKEVGRNEQTVVHSGDMVSSFPALLNMDLQDEHY